MKISYDWSSILWSVDYTYLDYTKKDGRSSCSGLLTSDNNFGKTFLVAHFVLSSGVKVNNSNCRVSCVHANWGRQEN